MNMLEIKNMHKAFGSKKVIDGLELKVPEHSIFGFIGRNGAGKTTTMKSVLGLMKIDEGEILVDGDRVYYGQTKTNKKIGYLPDVPEFYNYMTPEEYLRFCGEITGLDKTYIKKKSEELLFLVGLGEEKRRIKGFSRGMKQRLGIAQALLGNPKLLICDEPTSALDPVGRKEILEILAKASKETTVVFSTHILSDVERICTDVAFLNEGKIAVEGTIKGIKEKYDSEEFIVELNDDNDRMMLKKAYPFGELQEGGQLAFKQKDVSMAEIMKYIYTNDIAINKLERKEANLETMFMNIVNS